MGWCVKTSSWVVLTAKSVYPAGVILSVLDLLPVNGFPLEA